MSRLVDISVAFFAGPLLLATVPRPCLEAPQPLYTFHTGNEKKFPLYVGEGENRQIIIFCLHNDPETHYISWPAHVVALFDDPAPVEELAKEPAVPEVKGATP